MGSAIVSSFWHGGSTLPLHIWFCLKSFIDFGFDFRLYCYRDIHVPPGVTVIDAAVILPESSLFTYQTGDGAGSVAGFTNLFRYKLLYEEGGWWVDADVVCLRRALPAGDVVFGWESDSFLGNAAIHLPKNHPLAGELYRNAKAIIERRGGALEWGETGPRLLTRIATEQGLLALARPTRVFYPINYSEANWILQPEKTADVHERAADSTLFHLWNEIFRRQNSDPSLRPPAGSYLASIYQKHRGR